MDETKKTQNDEGGYSVDDLLCEIASTDVPPPQDVPPSAASLRRGTSVKTSLSPREALAKVREMLALCDLPHMLMVRVITAYFLVSGLILGNISKEGPDPIQNWREFIGEVSFSSTMLWMLGVVLILTIACVLTPRRYRVFDPLLAVGAVLYFDIAVLWWANDVYLTIGVLIVSLVCIGYALSKLRTHRWFDKLPWWAYGLAAVICAALTTVFIAMGSIHRHYIFGSGAHDFGLFVQMFHSLITDLTAVTTCERDTFMSHFDIHASYIFYLLVPIFKLFPYEETLLISQAVLAMGGIVPLVLIAKKRGFRGISLLGMGAAYAFCVALIAPCFYEFHENAFLPTLLMWTLWAVDTKKVVPFYIFAGLTCIVKEDAPLFVMCIGLYWFFENKDTLQQRLHGMIAALVSCGYMVYITDWLMKHGDGQMMTSSRFGHLLLDPEGGFAEVVQNSLSDPAYFFSLLVQEDTLIFLLQIMLPLLFLPFFTKKLHRFLLMLPFVVTNLIIGANYGYAAQIGYQYIFGPVVLLIYMALINVNDLTPRLRRNIPVMLGCAALIFAVGTVSHRIDYVDRYKNDEAYFLQLEATLDAIPMDASIGADAFLVPHVCDRKEVYIFDNGDLNANKTAVLNSDRYDFIVMQLSSDVCKTAAPLLEAEGFTVWTKVNDRIVIYQSPNY